MLVVGLGNPGARYCGTPHNVGFRVLDALVEKHRGEQHRAEPARAITWQRRFQADVAVTSVDQEALVLLKPLTFMNRSGESVRQALSFYNLSEQQTLVVHDEIDLPLGALKLKRGGGEAGHNGLKSVSSELGTREYCRLRVGVGRPSSGDVAEFLLAPMPAELEERLGPTIGAASEAIELVARRGVDRAMAIVNRPAAVAPAPGTDRPD
jgi:PTH1 family peptidyl-tRNA hydrolase